MSDTEPARAIHLAIRFLGPSFCGKYGVMTMRREKVTCEKCLSNEGAYRQSYERNIGRMGEGK